MNAQPSDRDHSRSDAHMAVVPVGTTGQDQRAFDAHSSSVLATLPDQTTHGPMPTPVASGPATIQQDHLHTDLHGHSVLLDLVGQGHGRSDTHVTTALADPSQANEPAEPRGLPPGMGVQPDEASAHSQPSHPAPRPADALLLIFADALDDLERVRIATENRVRSLAQVKGLDGTPESDRLQRIVDGLAALEHDAELQLKRELRKHPLGPWVRATIGIGEKQGARLLAAIGDPAWNHAEDRPRRGPAELWAYCGLHVINPGHASSDDQSPPAGEPSGQSTGDAQAVPAAGSNYPSHTRSADHVNSAGAPSGHIAPDVQSTSAAGSGHPGDHTTADAQPPAVSGVAPKRARGQKANWNATAKMRVFLIAESCIKQAASPYRAVYDDGRVRYADATHPQPCARCGPSGKPAQPGSPLSAGHQHARALRLVMKAVLRDLWIEARRSP